MKDYLLLFRGGDARMAELSEKESATHMEKWNAYMDGLARSGNLTGGSALQETGKLLKTHGTTDELVLTEKGEAVGGYLLIKADDYKHAVELSKSCPIFEFDGHIEIRETLNM